LDPSGRFSARNIPSLQPTFVVEPDEVGATKVAKAVNPATGVVLNEMVGSAPAVVGDASAGRANVGRDAGVSVTAGADVDVGIARAVCVYCTEN